MKTSEIEADFKERRTRAKKFWGPFREKAQLVSQLMRDSTLDDDELAYLDKTNRVDPQDNPLRPIIATMVGETLQMQVKLFYESVDQGPTDDWEAEWRNALAREIIHRTRESATAADASEENRLYGFSAVFSNPDDSSPNLEILVKQVSCFELLPDPESTEHNFVDAGWFIHDRMVSRREAKERWPGVIKGDKIDVGAPSAPTPMSASPIEGSDEDMSSGEESEMVKVSMYQWRERKKMVLFQDPVRGIQRSLLKPKFEELLESRQQEFESALEESMMMGEPVSQEDFIPEQLSEYLGWHYQSARMICDDSGTWKAVDVTDLPDGFTYRFVTCFRSMKDRGGDRKVGVDWYGMGRLVLPTIRALNWAWRVFLEVQARGAKGGGIIEEDLLDGVDATWQDFLDVMATPGGWARAAAGMGIEGKIKELRPAPPATGLENLLFKLQRLPGDVLSAGEFVTGASNRERSGRFATSMQQQQRAAHSRVSLNEETLRREIVDLAVRQAIRTWPADQLDRYLLADGEVQPIEGVTHEMNPQTGELEPFTTPGQILKSRVDQSWNTRLHVVQGSAIARADNWETLASSGVFEFLKGMGPAGLRAMSEIIKSGPFDEGSKAAISKALEEGDIGQLQQVFQSLPPGDQQGFAQWVIQFMQAQMGGQPGGGGGQPQPQGPPQPQM